MALIPKKPETREEELAMRKDAQQEVFLREVDDALREDQMTSAMKRYGVMVLVAVGVGLAGLAGWLWYDNHNKTQAGLNGETFIKALDEVEAGRLETGLATMNPIIKEGGSGYRASVQMMAAGIAAERNKPAEAARMFAAVAADTDLPKAYRDLALIREIALNFDKLPPEKVIERLKPLAVPGNPYFGSAGELVGVAYMKQGRNDLAGPLFGAIAKDETVPQTLRRRIQQLAGLLGVDAIADPEKAVAQIATSGPQAAQAPAQAPTTAENSPQAGAPAGGTQ